MRLKADIWARAHMRRAEAGGAMAVVAKKGDPDAGAIFVKILGPDRSCSLFGPAVEEDEGIRRWRRLAGPADTTEADVDGRLAREARIDPDIWIVEIEDRWGRHFLDDHLDTD